MTLACVVRKNRLNRYSIVVGCLNPVGRRVTARARYRSKAGITGFPNLFSNYITFLVVTRNDRESIFIVSRNMKIGVLGSKSQIVTIFEVCPRKLVTRPFIQYWSSPSPRRSRPERELNQNIPQYKSYVRHCTKVRVGVLPRARSLYMSFRSWYRGSTMLAILFLTSAWQG